MPALRCKIIRQETLHQCEERIVYYWRIQNSAHPERFRNEVSRTLLGTRDQWINLEKPALTALSEALEMVAIQRGVERWGEGSNVRDASHHNASRHH